MLKRSTHGFSIIQSLVAIAIVGVLMALAVPMLNDQVRDSRIRAIADEYRSGIALARQEAIQRNAQVQFQTAATGWRVVLLGASTTTLLYSRTGLNAEANYNISASAPSFTFGGNGRPQTGGAQTLTLDLGHVGGACRAAGGGVRCLRVIANAGGAIRACDPAIAAPDPRGCA